MDVLIGWPGGDWQSTARIAGALVGSYFALLWVASILWAYRDIRGRTRDPVSHIVAVGIVGSLPLVGPADLPCAASGRDAAGGLRPPAGAGGDSLRAALRLRLSQLPQTGAG